MALKPFAHPETSVYFVASLVCKVKILASCSITESDLCIVFQSLPKIRKQQRFQHLATTGCWFFSSVFMFFTFWLSSGDAGSSVAHLIQSSCEYVEWPVQTKIPAPKVNINESSESSDTFVTTSLPPSVISLAILIYQPIHVVQYSGVGKCPFLGICFTSPSTIAWRLYPSRVMFNWDIYQPRFNIKNKPGLINP